VARALPRKPHNVLLDGRFGALHTSSAARLRGALFDARKRLKLTSILVTQS